MNRDEAEALYQRYVDGKCTSEEMQSLDASFLSYLKSRKITPTEQQLEGADKRIYAAIQQHITETMMKRRNRFQRFLYPSVAAAILLIASSATWFFVIHESSNKQEVSLENDALPGGNRAKLTLADGRVIDLNSSHRGIIMEDMIRYQDGSKVIDNGNLGLQDETANVSSGSLNMMTLTTPQGGTYQVVLPDGSKVWLNAASTLRYPVRFDDGYERVVELEGEAYFEIKAQKTNDESRMPAVNIPFKVITKGQTVEVLGTAFNVSAYQENAAVLTTLVDGSIKLYDDHAKNQKLLIPGQQASLNERGFVVRSVDTDKYTAWKEGYFYFDEDDVFTVMEQLKRWYDIEVHYEVTRSDDRFVGRIPRTTRLNNVLVALENTGVRFEWTGPRELTVKYK